ncbi:MAG: ATP-binding cassette domain-containing protein [bacterium]
MMNSESELQPAIIDLREVSYRYAQGAGIFELSLRVEKGELVIMEGPTGAGKTTLVRVLTGELPLQAGWGQVAEISLRDLKGGTLSQLRGRLGLIFQEEHFLESESVLANAAAPLAIDGKPRSEQKAQALKMLVEVGLAPMARKKPSQLSGGEKARLQIARALIREPQLLIADEPFAHLDNLSAAEVAELILRAHRRGTTVLVMTNRQDVSPPEARRFFLEKGRLRE